MACPTCGNSILFGGIKEGKKKYCSKKCYEADEINRAAAAKSMGSDSIETNIGNGGGPQFFA